MKRIVIVGISGAGKSTLALRLAEKLHLPVYHLDKLYWLPGWVEPDKQEFAKKVAEIALEDAWIIEGTYEKTLDVRLERADTIVLFDFTPLRSGLQVLKRWWTYRGDTRPDMAPGNVERLNFAFFKYILFFHFRSRPNLMEKIAKYKDLPGKRLIVLKNRTDVEQFLEKIS